MALLVSSPLGAGHHSQGWQQVGPPRQRGSPSLFQLGLLTASSSSPPVGCCSSCLAVCIFMPTVGSVHIPFGSNGFQALPLVQNSNQGCPTQAPLMPFIWACYVSSALQLVLICSHLLIFILLIDSLYSSLSEAHPNWSLPCFLSKVQCSLLFVLLMVQFGMMSSEQAKVFIPLLPPMFHQLKCWWSKSFVFGFRVAPSRLIHSCEPLCVLHPSAFVFLSWPPAGNGFSVITWPSRQRGWDRMKELQNLSLLQQLIPGTRGAGLCLPSSSSALQGAVFHLCVMKLPTARVINIISIRCLCRRSIRWQARWSIVFCYDFQDFRAMLNLFFCLNIPPLLTSHLFSLIWLHALHWLLRGGIFLFLRGKSMSYLSFLSLSEIPWWVLIWSWDIAWAVISSIYLSGQQGPCSVSSNFWS